MKCKMKRITKITFTNNSENVSYLTCFIIEIVKVSEKIVKREREIKDKNKDSCLYVIQNKPINGCAFWESKLFGLVKSGRSKNNSQNKEIKRTWVVVLKEQIEL